MDVVRRLRSVGTATGKGQVNDQDGHVGGGHVEAEAREVAAARGERDGPLRRAAIETGTPRPPFGTVGDHLLGRNGPCVALMALAERSRLAIDRRELARVRLVRLGRRRGERRGGRLATMRLWARYCSVSSLGRELIRRARLRGVDMPRRGWRQGRSSRGGHRRPLGNEGAVLGGLCRPRAPGLHSCSDCAHRKRLIVRSAFAGGGRGVVVLMKLVGRTRGLADRGGRREGLVLRGLRAGTRNVSAGARAVEWKRAASGRR
jgi:hypothetical protein